MLSLKAIRRRIRSVEKTKQITKAMQIVSATKFKRAEQKLNESSAYANQMKKMLQNLSQSQDQSHELFEKREIINRLLILVTSDKGLCGGYNANLIRKAEEFIRDSGQPIKVVTVGKKAISPLKKNNVNILKSYSDLGGTISFSKVLEMMDHVSRGFLQGEWDEVILLYPKFESAVSNIPTLIPLLPVEPEDQTEDNPPEKIDYIFEPSSQEILNQLIPKILNFRLYYYLMESFASEHSARMVSMKNATDNASDMVDSLTLIRNKARQAAITTEISEIVGGVEALKG